ncbi:hypothetical protein [Chitinophaga rhizosphaerae]|uniref:hypothetical protein n=1 Tax=Chitinophaga rhizosphaerae TaxID=1864947 RepID=UPI000F801CC7|nr:hypothetical protein [Chitinophaga rhizosphaerae]
MDFKIELQKLVDIVKNNSKMAGAPLTNEAIAKRLGYTRTHFSTLLGSNGKVYQEHLDNFKAHFRTELVGIGKPALPGDELNRERALLKVLVQRVAKQEAERLGISVEKALEEIERDTMIAWRDLEK